MKLLCFKFYHNHTLNEDFDFWVVKGGGIEKAPYRMVVPLHTESFSALTQLESVYKLRQLI